MQDLENNHWIILDPLRSTYEVYANLTVMTLLNLDHISTTENELYLKRKFV